MPKYQCKKCGFTTDDTDEFIQHKTEEALPKNPEVKPQKLTHRTVKDHLDCPTCYPKFAKQMKEHPKFIEDLKSMGYKKPDACPKCGAKTKRTLLRRICPNCGDV